MDINEIGGIIDYSALAGTTPECPQVIKDYIRESVNLGGMSIDLVPRLVAFPKDTFPRYRPKTWTKYYGLRYFTIDGVMWGLYRGPAEPAPVEPTKPTPPDPDPEQEAEQE